MGKDYISKPFPWHSKSKIGEDGYCKWQYYDRYIMKHVSKKERPSVQGTNMHMVFSMFFGDLKDEEILSFIDKESTTKIKNHPIRRFIYERCMIYVKPSERGNPFYKNVIRNFAMVETERFIQLCNRLTTKKDIVRFFKPLKTEQRWEIPEIRWFGTLDRVDVYIAPNGAKKIVVVDYKTGNIPTAIRNGPKNPLNQFTWELSTPKMKELHFYGIMYLMKAGWQLSPEVIDYLTNPDWWFYTKEGKTLDESKEIKKEYLKSLNTKKNNRWKMYKDGRELKQGDIILSIYYLGGDKPYKVMKEFNYRSYKSVIMHSNDLRSRDYNEIFVDHPSYVFNEFVCENYKKCSKIEECKEMCKDK
ncbi:hypothetical protein LCGC14_1455650 [marine sediment metagenome]|uniref:PD-(D/E)XK endonuclease-like domain-containing protein n=1 Tax=marine sediment metagenome TaxID=412755 RepID=A0A0F9K2S4_9ZZZZ